MCGIVGCITFRSDALTQVIRGLEMLEYRGYDSWGVAGITHDSDVWIEKQIGNIRQRKSSRLPLSSLAIGHTRWATHGGVNQRNAHPHADTAKRFVVVHNGVIENWEALKSALPKAVRFVSDTDTEIIPHLLAELPETTSLSDRLLIVSKQLTGNNAFVVLDTKTKQLGAACFGSPLLLGRGKKTAWVVSDVAAFPASITEYTPLTPGMVAVLSDDDWCLADDHGPLVPVWIPAPALLKRFELVEDGQMMLDELTESPQVVALSSTVPLHLSFKQKGEHRLWLTGAGTAYHAALWGAHWMRQRGLAAIAFPSSEGESWLPVIQSTDTMLAISQSGETRDTLTVLEQCQQNGIPTVALINREHSSMSRVADTVIMSVAGPEQAVLATKSLASQLVLLKRLADSTPSHADTNWGTITEALTGLIHGHLPALCHTISSLFEVERWTAVIGRGVGFPLALETALKLKEGAYVPADGLAGGELKHGSLALVCPKTPCFVMDVDDSCRVQLMQNAAEVKARGGILIGFSPLNNSVYDYWIPLPDLGSMTVLAGLVAAQYVTYTVAVKRGINPDRPRNLAKSVTVE